MINVDISILSFLSYRDGGWGGHEYVNSEMPKVSLQSTSGSLNGYDAGFDTGFNALGDIHRLLYV